MLKKKIYTLFIICLTAFIYNFHLIANAKQSDFTKNNFLTKTDNLKEALKNLKPQNGDGGLLLAFDTDMSQDNQSYSQFYGSVKDLSDKGVTEKTLYLMRKDEKIELAAELDFVATPQKDGFLYLGQARYLERKPRDKNDALDSMEQENLGSIKNFGFDYTRIWKTDSKSKIPEAKKAVLEKIKKQMDVEYDKMSQEDREYHRNITDYQKISFVGRGFYVVEGFWALVHGGASWFDAYTQSDVVSFGNKKVSGKLKDHYFDTKRSAQAINKNFAELRKEYGNDRFDLTQKVGYVENSTFTLSRQNAQTHLSGLIMVDGNAHRSFHAEADFGLAPKKLFGYDNPEIDFQKFKQIYPKLIDIFVSPNQNTVFVLTDERIIGIDVKSKKEIFSENHKLKFNKVIMIEWATNDFVQKWEKVLSSK